MALLRYNASHKLKFENERSLFSYWMIGLGLALILLILWFLFPGRSLKETLLNQVAISEADLHYGILLNKTANLHYDDIKTNPLNAINKLNQELLNYQKSKNADDLWLDYIILRAIAYSPDLNPREKIQSTQAMQNYFEALKQLPNTDGQLEQLAKDALTMNQSQYALYFYEQLISRVPERSVEFYANAGRVALWSRECTKSADFYFTSQHKSSSLALKRYFYLKALNVLFQCNQSSLAISMAEKNLDGLSEDIETYQTLIDMAIRGNQPALAQQFLLKFLQLKNAKPQ